MAKHKYRVYLATRALMLSSVAVEASSVEEASRLALEIAEGDSLDWKYEGIDEDSTCEVTYVTETPE